MRLPPAANRSTAPFRRLALLLASALLAAAVSGEATAAADREEALKLAMQAQQASQNGDYETAVTRYRTALELRPELHRARFELARILAFVGQLEESASEFGRVVVATPEDSAARRGEITALLLLERYGDARRKLEEGLVALPRDGQLAHTLARLLASAPLAEVRDGPLAVALATSVYEVKQIFETGETLAMAHAESGDFDRAIELQRQLLERAAGGADQARSEALRQRLLSYLRHEPWRATSAAEIALATEPPAAPPGRTP